MFQTLLKRRFIHLGAALSAVMGQYSKDPIVQTLYDQIYPHWPISKKSRAKRKSHDQVDDAAEDADGYGDGEVADGGENCDDDAYGEACLTANLGMEVVQPVVPVSDSQIPPDSMMVLEETQLDTIGETQENMETQEAVMEHPEPLKLFEEPEYPKNISSPVAPTVMENSSSTSLAAIDVVEIMDSPKLTITDPLPSATSYTSEDLQTLRSRIAAMKQL